MEASFPPISGRRLGSDESRVAASTEAPSQLQPSPPPAADGPRRPSSSTDTSPAEHGRRRLSALTDARSPSGSGRRPSSADTSQSSSRVRRRSKASNSGDKQSPGDRGRRRSKASNSVPAPDADALAQAVNEALLNGSFRDVQTRVRASESSTSGMAAVAAAVRDASSDNDSTLDDDKSLKRRAEIKLSKVT